MPRADVTAESLHRRQVGTTRVRSAIVLGPDDKCIALFRCTQLLPW